MTPAMSRKNANPVSSRQSFSNTSKNAISHKGKINLFVEGETDANFYANLGILNDKKINIQGIEAKKQYIIKNQGPQKGKRAVLWFVSDRLSRIKNDPSLSISYGIVDRDFDNLLPKEFPNIGNYVVMTDANDLETTLLQLDGNNIEQNFIKDINSSAILNLAIDNASCIGKLRKLRQERNDTIPNNNGCLERNVKINFTNKEMESTGTIALNGYTLTLNGYYPFVDNKMLFNQNLYFGKNFSSSAVAKINNNINQYKNNALSYCRGHDIFDFVAIIYFILGKIEQASLDEICKNKGGFKKEASIVELRSIYEEKMEGYFDKKMFKNSKLYSFFTSLNNLN